MSHAASIRRHRIRGGQPLKEDDVRSTRERVLETAGEIFAEKGFDRTTSKEICGRAGANVAAVNYYFGSIDGLYACVLDEAQRRFITYDAIVAAVAAQAGAKEKLRALIGLAVARLTSTGKSGWAMRVIAREMAAPSEAFMALRRREILPRALLMKSLVSEIVGLPPDHPAVARASLTIIAPFAMLSIADHSILETAFPALSFNEIGAEALADHLYRYAMAGLADVRKRSARRR
ncbi:MAG: CerR family C-terminal domain-containing protein [Rhizomicrobium sp.]|jgi:AcrR family transcriptional regulator